MFPPILFFMSDIQHLMGVSSTVSLHLFLLCTSFRCSFPAFLDNSTSFILLLKFHSYVNMLMRYVNFSQNMANTIFTRITSFLILSLFDVPIITPNDFTSCPNLFPTPFINTQLSPQKIKLASELHSLH